MSDNRNYEASKVTTGGVTAPLSGWTEKTDVKLTLGTTWLSAGKRWLILMAAL
ncbi:MAG: hypothetical protein ACW97W_06935 [Candidatus Hodarchaeales archaeon]